MEYNKTKNLFVFAALIGIVFFGFAVIVFRHQLSSFVPRQITSATKKQPPLYINREFLFSLRFPESSFWNEYVVDDSIRVRDLAIISFKLYDSSGVPRTVFDVMVIPGSYSSSAELDEIYGPIGYYLAKKDNRTFVYRYVYGTQNDSGHLDKIVSNATDAVPDIIKSFQTINNSSDHK